MLNHFCFSVRQPPKRMLPPSIPISQPVRSPKLGVLPSPSTSHVHAKYDVLVWFEICELGTDWYYLILSSGPWLKSTWESEDKGPKQ